MMLTFIKIAIELATMLLLLMAVIISSSSTLKNMVRVYVLQATMLAAITFLTAVESAIEHGGLHRESVLVGALSALPCVLAFFIPKLLARATVTDTLRARNLLLRQHYRKWFAEAEPIWLSHGHARVSSVVNILINLGLTVFAFSIAFRLTESGQPKQAASLISPASMAVSLALLLVGLLVMIIKTDIISQIMGLLIMEHGLFLAAIAVVGAPAPALVVAFVFSMVAYIFITLLILVLLLPAVHAHAGSIEINSINGSSHLKG